MEWVNVDVVTPEKHFASAQASLVEVPGVMGDFGVLPGHAPLISAIRPGVVSLHVAQGVEKYLVLGGVAEVTPERCTILAEYVEPVASLSKEAAVQRLAEAKKQAEAALTDEEKRVAARNVSIAQALADSLGA